LYPIQNYYSPTAALSAIYTDLLWRCPTKLLADQLSAYDVSTFVYNFERVPPFVLDPCFGAAHTFDLPYLFPDMQSFFIKAFGGKGFGDEDYDLMSFMISSWTLLAQSYNPNFSQDNPSWKSYNNATAPYLRLDLSSLPAFGYGSDSTCSFWAQHPCQPNLKTCQSN